jgi:hypothetical protein
VGFPGRATRRSEQHGMDRDNFERAGDTRTGAGELEIAAAYWHYSRRTSRPRAPETTHPCARGVPRLGQTGGMRIEMVSEPGDPRGADEDWVSAALPVGGRGGAFVVLDGVTPPADDDGCVHGVPWFVARLGGSMLQLAVSGGHMTLADCLAGAIADTAAAHRTTCDLSHRRTPQATVAAARWDAERVDFLVLSDAVLLLEAPGGRVTPVLDDRLSRLPEAVGALAAHARALPPGSAARAAARRKYAAAVEALRNAADGSGFHTAAADPAVAARAVTGTAPRADVSALYGLTDGAARWSEVFRLGDWAALCALVRDGGPGALVGRVRRAERDDPDGAAFPRGKRHDDATALLAVLGPPGG